MIINAQHRPGRPGSHEPWAADAAWQRRPGRLRPLLHLRAPRSQPLRAHPRAAAAQVSGGVGAGAWMGRWNGGIGEPRPSWPSGGSTVPSQVVLWCSEPPPASPGPSSSCGKVPSKSPEFRWRNKLRMGSSSINKNHLSGTSKVPIWGN